MNELFNFIKDSVAKIAERSVEEIDGESHFQEDLEMDSLEAVEVIHLIEARYRIKFPDIDLGLLQTVQNIYKAALQLLDEKKNSTD